MCVKLKGLVCLLSVLIDTYEIPNSKHQVSGFQVSGVRCQVSGKKNKKTET